MPVQSAPSPAIVEHTMQEIGFGSIEHTDVERMSVTDTTSENAASVDEDTHVNGSTVCEGSTTDTLSSNGSGVPLASSENTSLSDNDRLLAGVLLQGMARRRANLKFPKFESQAKTDDADDIRLAGMPPGLYCEWRRSPGFIPVTLKIKRAPVITLLTPDQLYRDKEAVRQDNDDNLGINNELVWHLKTVASLLPRDDELQMILKRKAEAWIMTKRPDWDARTKHEQMARAIPLAMTGGFIDDAMRRWLKRHHRDPMIIDAFNASVKGAYVPRRPMFSRIMKSIGFRKYADGLWRKSYIQVLPKAK